MNEQQHIERCIELMEQDLEWGPSSEWTTYNFDKLSSYIKEKSNISLSGRTLRRLICGPSSFKPQAATKNALAKYVGYEDWEQFKRSDKQKGNAYTEADTSDLSAAEHTFLRLLRKGWFYLIPVFILIIILYVVLYPVIVLKLNTMRVEFTSNYTTGTAPQRVTFFYDVSRVNSSNIFIDENFYDDGNIIPINKNRHFFTSDFILPDHYSVKIIANGERLSCIRIHVLTNGWEGILNGTHLGQIYMDPSEGFLHVPLSSLPQYTDTSLSDYNLEYRNIREFNANGDDMTLETEIRLSDEGYSNDCRSTTIQIMNLHGRIGFTFVKPGCDPSLLEAEFGDVLLNGEFHELSPFYQELDRWRKVKIKTDRMNIYVYLDEVLIYSVKYKDPLDEMKGLTFKFQGSGQVNFVKLYNQSDELIYEEDF